MTIVGVACGFADRECQLSLTSSKSLTSDSTPDARALRQRSDTRILKNRVSPVEPLRLCRSRGEHLEQFSRFRVESRLGEDRRGRDHSETRGRARGEGRHCQSCGRRVDGVG